MAEETTVIKLDKPLNYLNLPYSTDPELSTILVNAYQRSPIVREALHQELTYHQHLAEDQNQLLALNSALWTSHTETPNLYSLQQQTLAQIDQDLWYVGKLNQALEPYEAAKGEIPWSLETNKMQQVLVGAKELVADDVLFAGMVQGKLPADWANTPPFPVLLGDQESLYGNSKITFLSAALVETNLVLADGSTIQDIAMPTYGEASWIDTSALAHVVPLPDSLHAEDIAPHFTDEFSFYFSDDTTPQGLAFIHSSYAFGGQRLEERYPEGKVDGPEDCSSWMAKITHSDVDFSTIDQLYTYRLGLPENEQGYIDPNWLSSKEAASMPQHFSPVIVNDPFTDIQPGQVYFFRTFSDSDHQDSAGNSGHTALVLGVRENGDVVTLGYQRNMPGVEGFGISEFPWQSSEKTEVMFLNVKEPINVEDVISDMSFIPGLVPESAATVVPAAEPEPPMIFVYPIFEAPITEQVIIV